MGEALEQQVDDREVRAALKRLRRGGADLSTRHARERRSPRGLHRRGLRAPSRSARRRRMAASEECDRSRERRRKGYGPERPILERSGELPDRILSDFDDSGGDRRWPMRRRDAVVNAIPPKPP